MRSGSSQRVERLFNHAGCPATVALLVINVLGFLVNNGMRGASPFQWLVFTTYSWPRYPWTLVTWPLVGAGDPWTLLFAAMWSLSFLGSLERGWGTRTFVLFFTATSALTALSVWIGARLLRLEADLGLLWIALGPPTVAWCTINRRERISVWGVLTVPAAGIGAFTSVLVWYYVGHPILGLFALTGCAAAYWYANSGRYAFRGYAAGGSNRGARPHLRMQNYDPESISSGSRWNPIQQFRSWQERRKLARLWKRSFKDDDPNGNNRPGR